MLRLGLTGGIASGKSAVAAMLRDLGFSVLDADSLAHKLIEPGQPAGLMSKFAVSEGGAVFGKSDSIGRCAGGVTIDEIKRGVAVRLSQLAPPRAFGHTCARALIQPP